jgi:cob(I)alamin adenosyltransferase
MDLLKELLNWLSQGANGFGALIALLIVAGSIEECVKHIARAMARIWERKAEIVRLHLEAQQERNPASTVSDVRDEQPYQSGYQQELPLQQY